MTRSAVPARPRRPLLGFLLLAALCAGGPALAQDAAPAEPPAAERQRDGGGGAAAEPPGEEAPVDESSSRITLEDGTLRAVQDGATAWTLPLPSEGGPVRGPLIGDDVVFVAHGLYLLEVDATDGTVLHRDPLPAPAAELVEETDAGIRVAVRFASGAEGTMVVGGDDAAPVRFGVLPERFGWLRAASAAADDPSAALQRDPGNPWLTLRASAAADDLEERAALWDRAARSASALPFFEAANLALALADAGAPERAERAMEAALQDFAARDYDPRLLTDRALRDAYGFPLSAMTEAVERGELEAAERWAPYVWRLASEEAPETLAGLRDLSRALREAGERDAADLWRQRADDLHRAGLSTWVDRSALSLGRFGWWGVAALTAAFALAWATLLAKVWRAQSLARRQRRERAEVTRPWSRAWVPRQASTTEKVALLLVLIAAGFMATLAAWATRADEAAPAFRTGTLASLPARQALAELPDTPWAHLARGVSYHVQGEAEAAEAAYRVAGERAPALVNLALLTGDDALLQAALRVDPRNEVARFHLGRAPNPSPFHAAYGGAEPLLAVPSPLEFALASGGDWREAFGAAAGSPWRSLREARPAALPAWAWWTILVAYALLLLALVVQLAFPRPRVAREAPRTPPYHPLALLVPGSGHLDELWGLLLLVPWSIVGMDALLQARGGGALGLSLHAELWILAALYLANLVGFVVELASYRRRMRLLRERKPELARSYGLPPLPARTET